MLQFEVKGDILFVYGNEIFEGDYRMNLKNYLHSTAAASASCPVQQGTHDFWLTFGSTGKPNHSHEDMLIKPRPLRGIVEMGEIYKKKYPRGTTEDFINANQVSTLLQEVGHHWLVPRDLSIKNEAFWPSTSFRPYQILGRDEISLSLEEGTPYYGPPLLGRDNSHWSFFFQADQSVMDGIKWIDDGSEDGYTIWKQHIVAQPYATPDGLNPIMLEGQYNDLDLLLMGVKNAGEAYKASNSTFQWFEPRLTAPLDYFAGLFVAFSRYHFFYFGFYRDHRKIATWDSRVPGPAPDKEFPLPDYRPLANEFNSIALRIVRDSKDYYFQAKLYGPTRPESLLEGIDNIPFMPIGPGPLDRPLNNFRTLDKLSNSEEPKAMGFIVKTKTQTLISCDAAFFNMKVRDESGKESVISPKEIPPTWDYPTSDDFSTLPSFGSLVFNNPVKKARIRLGHGWPNNQWLYLTTLYGTISSKGLFEDTQSYDHSDDPTNPSDPIIKVDEAPKILTRVPPGKKFAVATAAKINRSSCCPWAGFPDPAQFPDLRMWGKAGYSRSSDVVLPDKSIPKQSLPDPTGTYKVAFILVSNENSFPLIYDKAAQRLDIIRRYWDDAFEKVTLGRRHSNSKLR